MPDDAAALRMTHLLKMAQENNSSHVAVLDMLVEQLSNVQQQLVIQTIVMKNTSHASSLFLLILLLNLSEGRPNTTEIGSSLCKGNLLMRVNILIGKE